MLSRWLIPAVILTLVILFLFHLGSVGFLGPDEPRYASIGRAMAHSGDWITPRLDVKPWFEKPPLTYWLTALGHIVQLPDEWAARFPQFLVSVAFLLFFYGIAASEFSRRVASIAVAILATSVGWLAYSFVALTDLPMTAALNVAVLITLFDTRASAHSRPRGEWNPGWIAGAFLGLSILGKGLVPVVLFAPLILIARGKRLTTLAGALLVAAPWYILCYLRNGHAFWDDFFWKQHVARFISPSLEHVQPFWFYVPVLIGGLFPWSPLLALLGGRKIYNDLRVRTLAAWVVYGFVFFSISRNKLPGYLLPLMPALAMVLAAALNRSRKAGLWLAGCGFLLAILPTAARVLPEALRSGLSRSHIAFVPVGLIFIAVAALAWWFSAQENVYCGVLTVALATGAAVVYLTFSALPVLDREVSARQFYRESAAALTNACLSNVNRALAYGLNYYANRPFPPCGPQGGQTRIIMVNGRLAISNP